MSDLFPTSSKPRRTSRGHKACDFLMAELDRYLVAVPEPSQITLTPIQFHILSANRKIVAGRYRDIPVVVYREPARRDHA